MAHILNPRPLTRGHRLPDLWRSSRTLSWRLNILCACLLVMLASTAGVVRAQSFGAPLNLPAPEGSRDVAVGDFNNDGHPDLVSANSGDSTSASVSIFLGSGDGTFGPRTDLPAVTNAESVVVADFNKDGKRDLVVVSRLIADGPQGGSIFLGNGDGSFKTRTDFPLDTFIDEVVAADFNEDGNPDIAAVKDGMVDVLLGNGDGSLQPKVVYFVAGFSSSLVAADLNGDGHTDIASASSLFTGLIGIMLGKGDGTFQAPTQFACRFGARGLSAGDLNGDGKLDLATANTENNFISVLLGNGDGSFRPQADFPTGQFPQSLKLADFDGDGKLDAVAAGPGRKLYLLPGNGDGTLRAMKTVDTGGAPVGVAAADVNHDNKTDLLCASIDGSVQVLLNRTGTLTVGGRLLDDADAPVAGATVTLSGAGIATTGTETDAAGAYSFGGIPAGATVSVTPSKRNYVFTPPARSFEQLSSDVTADFTGTLLRFDIRGTVTSAGSPLGGVTVTLSGGDSAVTTTAADGTYAFTSLPASRNYTVTPSLPRFIFTPSSRTITDLSANIVANFTGSLRTFSISGRARDAVRNAPVAGLTVTLSGSKTATATTGFDGAYSFTGLTIGGDYTVTVSPRPSDTLFRNYLLSPPLSRSFLNLSSNVVGDFEAVLLVNDTNTSQGDCGMAAGDFNGDGKVDLAVSRSSGFGVSLLLGNGDGSFQPVRQVALAESSALIVSGDFDGDGMIDLALANRDTQRNPIITILYGNGDATFQSKTFALPKPNSFSFARGSTVIVAADMNRDGKLDIIEAGGTTDINGTTFSLNVLVNDGGRDFKLAPATALATSPRRARAAEFNGDGKPDLVLASDPSTVSILFGNGDGTYAAPSDVTLGGQPIVGDFNNDGKTDIVAHSGVSGQTRALLGNGDGTFKAPVTSNVPGGALDAADFNGDGKLDLAVLNSGASKLDTFFGDGNGAFSPVATNNVNQSPSNFIVGDFNGDGAPDVAATDLRSGGLNVTVLVNTNAVPSVRFSAATYNVGERDGAALITVTRTGDLSRPASVSYASSDGTASERSDYMAAFGTLNFAAGESSKSFTVFITGDALTEGSETLSLGLGGSVGATLGGPSTATLTIANDDSVPATANPADDPAFFVRQHYRDFLNRDPDAQGLAFWTGNITECGADAGCREVKRINVSAAFFLSIEFQETGYLAYRTYKTAYGDLASPNVAGTVPAIRLREFLSDAQRIGREVQVNVGDWERQLESNKQEYALEFVSRQRFTDAFPVSMTPAQFVDRLNQNAGGVLSQAERDQLVAELASATDPAQGRAAALRRVAEDAELRSGEKERAFVLMQYFGYLRRNPDDAPDSNFRGWKFWLTKLEQFGGNFVNAEMVKAFISSGEYRKRFGQ